MSKANQPIDELCINTLRVLAADMAQRANSGHPGLPMGAAPMGYLLWKNHLLIDPQAPAWPNRDRFVLSPGHGSTLLYGLMHLAGFADVGLEDLKAFRQWGSKTPGHPEFGVTQGVEATTGPLGQGAANVVGMAIAERLLAHRFNRPNFEIVDHHTFAIVSDGDLMEGVSAEAASLAGQLKLGKLICLYDANDITLDGPTSLTFSVEDVRKRYEAYGWQVLFVRDGDTDYPAIEEAISQARADSTRPSLIVVKTTIGFGSPNKQGKSAAHGAPLGKEELSLTKKNLGLDPDLEFHVPDTVKNLFETAMKRGQTARQKWEKLFEDYEKAHPELAEAWRKTWDGELEENWDENLPVFQVGQDQPTRNASGTTLNAIAATTPWLISGDADIGSSTKSQIKDGGSFDGVSGAGRNLHYGVREHAMAALANGMAYHGGVRPIVSTFFTFVDYMRPSIRVAALSHLPVILLFSHDSLAVGEDGPTHQPIEQLASLRIMPNVVVLRPGDPNEMVEAWRWCMQYTDGPVALITSRQDLPVIDRSRYAPAEGLRRGAYILAEPKEKPALVLLATGSELSLALETHERLAQEGIPIRIVSMPSWEIFQAQPQGYRDEVLPSGLPKVAVEAGVSLGWERWVGQDGEIIAVDRFGASAPGHVTMEKYGFTVDNLIEKVRKVLSRT